MTEEQWLAWRDPHALIQSIPYQANNFKALGFTDRRFRLFAVGCVRRVRRLCTHPLVPIAVDAVERFVDARTNEDRQRLKVVRGKVFANDAWLRTVEGRLARAVVGKEGRHSAVETSWYAGYLVGGVSVQSEDEREEQGPLLRDIFGNPFRPVAFTPSWLTPTAVGLAEGIYADCAFDRLPILADALQDAGCEDAEVLGHCRSDGPHVRGCWVVDGVLGRDERSGGAKPRRRSAYFTRYSNFSRNWSGVSFTVSASFFSLAGSEKSVASRRIM
ncbi:hypothetical protein PX52LOC_00874 [Limnoglobus roseus]|uniref:SMI1/KNR4 family protein n=1 Tax=Limnoglobus roseus TaxID=2598579 RepID=A0A5C1A8B5_9BACT|nr:hypothetical protein PX52LOC_00874 [Limnoglobus roseus]